MFLTRRDRERKGKEGEGGIFPPPLSHGESIQGELLFSGHVFNNNLPLYTFHKSAVCRFAELLLLFRQERKKKSLQLNPAAATRG